MADERIDEVLDKFPLVKKHMEYVLAGGDSQKFMKAYDPNLDYNEMEIAEDDARSQKAILTDYFQQKGHDSDFIKEMLEDIDSLIEKKNLQFVEHNVEEILDENSILIRFNIFESDKTIIERINVIELNMNVVLIMS